MPRCPAPPSDPPLPAAPAVAIARARVDPTAARHAVPAPRRRANADRGGSVDRDYDGRGWAVYLLAPDREQVRGTTLQEALAWCLVWLIVEEFAGETVI